MLMLAFHKDNLGPLLLSIYINDFSDEFYSNVTLFADAASIFLVIQIADSSARELNDNLKKNIERAFVRPYIDYGDVLYCQAFNNSFHRKLESVQYNMCLAVTNILSIFSI